MTDILHQTIGRYEIQEMIGEGAMAKVYRAFDPEINRSVAFKVLKSDFCVDEEYLSRFLREAKAAGALSHSNIVTVFDVGEIENSPYIMMELLEGKDLGDVLKERKKLSVDEVLIIALQLAKALNYAHKAGIVHRDIKPDNIIVLPDGETIKVADFGIARMDSRDEMQKTQVGSVLGTPRYMSPEQALGENADGRADLFAVGVIMYEMLTGNKAFDGENIGTLMTQITQKQPPPIGSICPEVPAGLRQIIQKLLHKKPERRFQTGSDLAKALAKELTAVRDQEEEQQKHKYVPLKIRWAIYMGSIVTVVLLISMSVVFTIQSRAMTSQVVDSGSSFAKFIAIETAVPLLSEDWITLETFISEAASRDTFRYLVVTDRVGIVRGATDSDLVGQPYQPSEYEELIQEKDQVKTTTLELAGGERVFNIQAPVLFQNTEVGQIILGLSQNGLDQVKSVTGWLMFALAVVTISSVVLMLFIFGAMLTKPLKILSQSLDTFKGGNHDTRISQTRNDEIGEVFSSFNAMAAKVQADLSPEYAASDELENSTASLNVDANSSEKTEDKSIAESDNSLSGNEAQAPISDTDEDKQKTAQTKTQAADVEEAEKKTVKKKSTASKKKAPAKSPKTTEKTASESPTDVVDETIVASSLLDVKKAAEQAEIDNDATIIGVSTQAEQTKS